MRACARVHACVRACACVCVCMRAAAEGVGTGGGVLLRVRFPPLVCVPHVLGGDVEASATPFVLPAGMEDNCLYVVCRVGGVGGVRRGSTVSRVGR